MVRLSNRKRHSYLVSGTKAQCEPH